MKKGISLVSLTIIIIVMTIITSVAVYSGLDSVNTAEINMFAVEITNIQTIVDDYHYRNESYPILDTMELDLSTIEAKSAGQFSSEQEQDGKLIFKKINLAALGINETKFGNGKKARDVYVLSENTGKVYYLLGVIYEGKTYYTLAEELYGLTNMTSNNTTGINDVKIQDITFSLSNKEYTNLPVTVDVKAPGEATVNVVTATESKSVGATQTIDGLNVIRVNATSDDKTGNYAITVNYTLNNITKMVTYNVENFDNVAPTFGDGGIPQQIVGNERRLTLIPQDDASGVKTIKYERNIDMNEEQAKTYFENYGTLVTGTEIVIAVSDKCLIYMEDYAGNKTVQTLADVQKQNWDGTYDDVDE